VLATLLALALVAGWLQDVPRSQVPLFVAELTICVIGIVRGWQGGARPIQIVTFGFLFAYLGVAPIYQIASNQPVWGDTTVLLGDRERTTYVLLLVVIGSAALLGGFLLSGVGVRTRGEIEAAPSRIVEPVRGTVAWGVLVVAVVLTPGAIGSAGGLAGLFSTRLDRSEMLARQGIDLATSGGFAFALTGLLPGALTVAATFLFVIRARGELQGRDFGSMQGSTAFGLIGSAALLVLHVNPFTASRFLVVLALGGCGILLARPRTENGGRTLAAVVLVGTLLVYPLLNFFRYGRADVLASGWRALASPDFDGFQQFINTTSYVDAHGHGDGLFTLSGLLYFVPRSIWPEKATPSAVLVAQDRGYQFTNLSMPVGSELYLDFGLVGMTLLLGVLGYLLGRVDLKWLQDPQSRLALIAPLVAVAMFGVIRGPIGASSPIYLSALIPVFLGLRPARSPGSPSQHNALPREELE
jgi:hypothetical protein